MKRGLFIFKVKRGIEGNLVLYQTIFSSMLFILFVFGFFLTFLYSKTFSGIGILGPLIVIVMDLILEWIIIIFLRKDAIRNGQQVIESGSLWKGNKEYKVLSKKT